MTTPAEVLADAIEAHRDHKYHGQIVSDPLDLTLYGAAVWFRTWEDHAEDPDAPILSIFLRSLEWHELSS